MKHFESFVGTMQFNMFNELLLLFTIKLSREATVKNNSDQQRNNSLIQTMNSHAKTICNIDLQEILQM